MRVLLEVACPRRPARDSRRDDVLLRGDAGNVTFRVRIARLIPMYAAVVKLTIDPAQAPAAAAVFTEKILPRIASAEGFRMGHWLDPFDGEGLGLVLFETREQAQRLAPAVFDWSAPGVTILGVAVRRVAVSTP